MRHYLVPCSKAPPPKMVPTAKRAYPFAPRYAPPPSRIVLPPRPATVSLLQQATVVAPPSAVSKGELQPRPPAGPPPQHVAAAASVAVAAPAVAATSAPIGSSAEAAPAPIGAPAEAAPTASGADIHLQLNEAQLLLTQAQVTHDTILRQLSSGGSASAATVEVSGASVAESGDDTKKRKGDKSKHRTKEGKKDGSKKKKEADELPVQEFVNKSDLDEEKKRLRRANRLIDERDVLVNDLERDVEVLKTNVEVLKTKLFEAEEDRDKYKDILAEELSHMNANQWHPPLHGRPSNPCHGFHKWTFFQVKYTAWVCSACSAEKERGAEFWGCPACDTDYCRSCFGKRAR